MNTNSKPLQTPSLSNWPAARPIALASFAALSLLLAGCATTPTEMLSLNQTPMSDAEWVKWHGTYSGTIMTEGRNPIGMKMENADNYEISLSGDANRPTFALRYEQHIRVGGMPSGNDRYTISNVKVRGAESGTLTTHAPGRAVIKWRGWTWMFEKRPDGNLSLTAHNPFSNGEGILALGQGNYDQGKIADINRPASGLSSAALLGAAMQGTRSGINASRGGGSDPFAALTGVDAAIKSAQQGGRQTFESPPPPTSGGAGGGAGTPGTIEVDSRTYASGQAYDVQAHIPNTSNDGTKTTHRWARIYGLPDRAYAQSLVDHGRAVCDKRDEARNVLKFYPVKAGQRLKVGVEWLPQNQSPPPFN